MIHGGPTIFDLQDQIRLSIFPVRKYIRPGGFIKAQVINLSPNPHLLHRLTISITVI